MKKIMLNFKTHSENYPIFIGRDLMGKISSIINIKKYSKVFIVTDKNLEKLFLKRIMRNLAKDTRFIVLSTSEQEKNIENVQKIWKDLVEKNCDRKSIVINLGGGVIGDMGGFAASTFKRGIDFINIPTTLLSQVDASVGGKTGIDFMGVKNLVGSFSQPKAVIVDIDILSTLPKREFLSGFTEIIKHGLIADKKYFEIVTSKKPFDFSEEELIDIIAKSIQIKKEIVESDETEEDLRKSLNFGHTIGHAIEALSLKTPKSLLHGEAISIGMALEAKMSNLLGLLSQNDLKIIENSLTNAGLPISVNNMDVDQVIKLMQSDKKNEKNQINFTLLSGIGRAVINQEPDLSIIKGVLK